MTDKKEVLVYTTAYCPYCRLAKQFLTQKGVEFKEVNVENDPEMREKLVEMSGGKTTVPQVFVDGKNIGGYDELVRFYKEGNSI